MDVCKRLSVPAVATLVLAGTVACADPVVAPESDTSYTNPYIEELAEAVEGLRLFEPRLSGGFEWGECQSDEHDPNLDAEARISSAQCGSLKIGTPERERVLGVWTRIHKGAEQAESPALLHAQGVGHLLWSTGGGEDTEKEIVWAIGRLTQALDSLSEETSENPPLETVQRAAVLNDLAVARRVKAGRSSRARDLISALEAAEEAYRTGSRSPEALFNRALLLDEMALRRVADKAWGEYLAAQDARPWALEAEHRVQRAPTLTLFEEWERIEEDLNRAALAADQEELRPLVASAPMLVWSFAQNIWLPAWGDTALAGEEAAGTEPLTLSREVGRALASLGLDRSVDDAVAAIDGAQSDPQRLRSLAEGHSAYGRGYRIERGREEGDGCEAYQSAERSLEVAGSPFALWAGLSVVQGCFERTDRPAAESRLESLSQKTSRERYPALTGRIEWMLSLTTGAQGRFEETLSHALRAQQDLERARDRDLPSVLALVSDGYRSLGSLESSWRARVQSLHGFLGFHHLAGYHAALVGGIYALFHEHRFLVAGPFTEELTLVADELGDPEHQAYAQALRARFLSEMGYQSDAMQALDSGDGFVRGLPEEGRRRQVDADLSVVRAQIEIGRNPHRAEAAADRAFRVLTDAGREATLPQLHLLRARAYAARGDIETSEKHFQLALDELEQRRGWSLREDNRISFFEMFQDSIDEILGFYVDRGLTSEAFQVAERSRSRALMDWVVRDRPSGADELGRVSRAFPEAWSLEELQASLSEGEVALEYAVLPDRLVTWVVRRDITRMMFRSVSAEDLLHKVTRFRSLLESFAPFEEVTALGGDLYEDLIEPSVDLLIEGDHLLVAPDRFLHRIPFAALYSRSREAFLVESHPISVMPSTSLLAAERFGEPWPESPKRLTLLAVAPTTEGEPLLPWAKREARELAEQFPRASLLVDDAATKQAVLEQLPLYQIIHFATHADYREAAPMQSSISLASGGGEGEGGRLTAGEIYGLDLAGTELVVLAACQTTDGYPGTGREGIAGWARALFAAGVPRVVAGLWELGDEASHQLMTELYGHLLSRSPARALRAAQIARIQSEESPSTWAQLQVYGDF